MMVSIIINIVLALIAGGISYFGIKKIKSLKEDIEAEKKKTAEAEYRKAKLVKNIDDVLLFQAEDKEIQKKTQEHADVLRKTGSDKNVKKELASLRNDIFTGYNQLRND